MRKQSPETQIRHLKREVNRLNGLLTKDDRRMNWGFMMSNICFNLGQKSPGYVLQQSDIDTMKQCRKGWDEA